MSFVVFFFFFFKQKTAYDMRISAWSSDVCSSDLVALEALRAARGKESLSIRQPWVIAFLFGLLHGFAFAGALTAIGLPPDAVPQALFLFNLGVELGQITFIGSVALLLAVRRFIPAAALRGREARNLAAYAIGTMACFWLRSEEHTSELQSLMRISY